MYMQQSTTRDTWRAYYTQNYSRNDLVTAVHVCANTPLATQNKTFGKRLIWRLSLTV